MTPTISDVENRRPPGSPWVLLVTLTDCQSRFKAGRLDIQPSSHEEDETIYDPKRGIQPKKKHTHFRFITTFSDVSSTSYG